MQIGYARISTDDQTLDLQRDAPTTAGCDQLFGVARIVGRALDGNRAVPPT